MPDAEGSKGRRRRILPGLELGSGRAFAESARFSRTKKSGEGFPSLRGRETGGTPESKERGESVVH